MKSALKLVAFSCFVFALLWLPRSVLSQHDKGQNSEHLIPEANNSNDAQSRHFTERFLLGVGVFVGACVLLCVGTVLWKARAASLQEEDFEHLDAIQRELTASSISVTVIDDRRRPVCNKAFDRLTHTAEMAASTQLPPTGKYEGTYILNGRKLTRSWVLYFSPDGQISGAPIVEGKPLYVAGCVSGGECYWGEHCRLYNACIKDPEELRDTLLVTKAFHIEVQLSIKDAQNGILEGHYFDSNGQSAKMDLKCLEACQTDGFTSTLRAAQNIINTENGLEKINNGQEKNAELSSHPVSEIDSINDDNESINGDNGSIKGMKKESINGDNEINGGDNDSIKGRKNESINGDNEFNGGDNESIKGIKNDSIKGSQKESINGDNEINGIEIESINGDNEFNGGDIEDDVECVATRI